MAKIIDIHTHFFPSEGLEENLRSMGETYWQSLLFPKEGRSLQDFPSQEAFIEAMDEGQISQAVLMGAYWQSTQACDLYNAKALEFAKAYPKRILPMAIISPKDLAHSIAFLRKARSLGFVGVGELCDTVQGFDVQSEGFYEILKVCEEEGLPVCFHLSDELGKDYKGKVITKNDAIFALAEKFPKLNFILSHLGGGRAFSNGNFPENIYFDCAAYPLLYKESLWGDLDFTKLKNICFGTDYSLRLYPKTSKKADFLRLKKEALKNIPTSEHSSIFCENAKRIFDL